MLPEETRQYIKDIADYSHQSEAEVIEEAINSEIDWYIKNRKGFKTSQQRDHDEKIIAAYENGDITREEYDEHFNGK